MGEINQGKGRGSEGGKTINPPARRIAKERHRGKSDSKVVGQWSCRCQEEEGLQSGMDRRHKQKLRNKKRRK